MAITQDLCVYPAQGQSGEQLSSDRDEHHRWDVQESDFGPTDFGEESPSTFKVAAIASAVIGSQDADARIGAVDGAVTGSMIGGVVEEQVWQEADQQAGAEVARQSEEINRTKAERALR